MKRAIGYARVSTDAQAGETRNSLPAQRTAILAYCAQRDYELAGEFTDVMSGRRDQRPQYQRLLAAARRGEVDVIVVTFLDRFGRDQWEIMARLGELRALGVEVEAVHEAVGGFIEMALSAWKADQESQRIGARIKLAAHSLTREGRVFSRTAYGYRKVKQVDGDRVVTRVEVDEAKAAVVRDIFRWHEAGAGIRTIALRLNALAVPSPGGRLWTHVAVRQILQRRTYLGEVHWGEVTAPAALPPLVDAALFERTQRRMGTRQGGRPSDYFLTGIAKCAHCGGPMNGNGTVTRGKWYRAYICATNRRTGACVPNWHRAEAVEDAVLAIVADLGGSASEIAGRMETDTAALSGRLRELDRELAHVDERFRANLRAYHAGLYASDEQYRSANAETAADQRHLQADRERIAAAIADAETRSVDLATLPDRARTLVSDIRRLPPLEARQRLRELVSRVELRDGDPLPVVWLADVWRTGQDSNLRGFSSPSG